MMNTKLIKPDDGEKGIAQAAELLRAGELVAIPTETVYGLAANALDGKAVEKIFRAKGRPQDNPLIVHISETDEIFSLVENFDDRARALARNFWPGPLTIILPKSPAIPSQVSAGLDTVAVRMPSHPTARAISKRAAFRSQLRAPTHPASRARQRPLMSWTI